MARKSKKDEEIASIFEKADNTLKANKELEETAGVGIYTDEALSVDDIINNTIVEEGITEDEIINEAIETKNEEAKIEEIKKAEVKKDTLVKKPTKKKSISLANFLY